MAWTIEYQDKARRQLRKLDRENARRIVDYLDHRVAPSDDPRSMGRPLHGNLKRYWRYRVGDYRLFCEIEDEKVIVIVVEIGHRREVYR